jgi:hypothetical protein
VLAGLVGAGLLAAGGGLFLHNRAQSAPTAGASVTPGGEASPAATAEHLPGQPAPATTASGASGATPALAAPVTTRVVVIASEKAAPAPAPAVSTTPSATTAVRSAAPAAAHPAPRPGRSDERGLAKDNPFK